MDGEFDLQVPGSLSELLNILATPATAERKLLAGGTVSLVDVRLRKDRPDLMLSLGGMTELTGIADGGEEVSIGAGTTVSALLSSALIADVAPSLAAAAAVFAGQMVRNAATIGGNIACGSPAADLVPPLLSLDADLQLASASGTRRVRLADYYTGYKQDIRRPEEVILRIILPRPPVNSHNAFYKLARRRGDAITVAGAAVTLAVREQTCSHVRVALGSVAPTPMRARKAEAMLEGRPLSTASIEAAADTAMRECSPIDDVRASAGYRRKMVKVLTRRLLTQACEHIRKGCGDDQR